MPTYKHRMKLMIRTLMATGLLLVMNSFTTAPATQPSGTYVAREFEFFPKLSPQDSSYALMKSAVEAELSKLSGKLSLTFHEDGTYEGEAPDGNDKGQWSISEDGRLLTLYNSEKNESDNMNIMDISDTTLVLEYLSEEGVILMKFTK